MMLVKAGLLGRRRSRRGGGKWRGVMVLKAGLLGRAARDAVAVSGGA